MPRRLFAVVLLATICFSSSSAAAEPEALPPPRDAGPNLAVPPAELGFPGYYRTSRYDVWQFYGVDRQGYFRPRVIYSPYGAYYLYNGAPFRYSMTHPLEWMPYTTGTPYR